MKKWPYWVKGGVCSFAVVIITTLVVFLFIPSHSGELLPAWLVVPVAPAILVQNLFIMFIPNFSNTSFNDFLNGAGAFLLAIIFYFIIGAIIGWIYGKIKNRKRINII